MIPCPRRDWTSDSGDDVNIQVAKLLRHYEETHGEGDGLPQDLRDLLTACANALEGAHV